MNSRKPSFHTLYAQSRPKAQPDEAKRMEQRERFAVASLAFVLLHDLDFRAAFLNRVCEWTGPGDAKDFDLQLELTNCGDLALVAEKVGIVFVIEFKIDAPPQPHQIPNTAEFFKTGYGDGISKAFANFKKRSYIMLRQCDDPIIPNLPHNELVCIAKDWQDVLECKVNSSLVDDLFNSLAQFHIRCFKHMITQKMNLTGAALDACRITILLKNVAEIAGWHDSEDLVSLESRDDGYIGRYVKWKAAPPNWRSFLAPKGPADQTGQLTWFGYERGSSANGLSRSVGFYCAAEKVDRVKKALHDYAGKLGVIDAGREYVWIESDPKQRLGDQDSKQPLCDQEWFVEIYERMRRAVES